MSNGRSQGGCRFRSVAVLMGGLSREREISLKSGKAISEALRKLGISVKEIDAGGNTLRVLRESCPEAVFVALHGAGGEDGTIQELLESLKIPYTGSGPRGSRHAFFKDEAKAIFRQKGIPTPQFCLFHRSDATRKVNFDGPWVVKPAAEGSSLGVSMVDERLKLSEEVARDLINYDTVLVEKRIFGREVTVGILEDKALPAIELRTAREFYDFDAKYTAGSTEYLIPAPLDQATTRQVQQIGVKVHHALELSDFSRVDIMIDDEGKPYVLEANSIPGFTDKSLLPKAARHVGIEFVELCLRILNNASLKEEPLLARDSQFATEISEGEKWAEKISS